LMYLLRYWRTYFALSMCPGDGQFWYWAIMLVIMAISGLVWVEIQLWEPTIVWSLDSNLIHCIGGMSMFGIESTGWPDWYGVGFVIVYTVSNNRQKCLFIT
jgi:hypothetical protein